MRVAEEIFARFVELAKKEAGVPVYTGVFQAHMVIQPVLEAVPKANDAGQQALLDVLMHFPSSEPVFRLALRMFREHPEKRSLFASYLGKLEDPRALPDLLAAANDPALGYVDYVEVRAAIERLGGEAPERTFDEDPEFWYMKSLDQ